MSLTDIDGDSISNILKKTDPPTWSRLMQVSVHIRFVTKDMLGSYVQRLSSRVRRVFSIRNTFQLEGLMHFFLRTSVRANHRHMSAKHRDTVEQLLMHNLHRRFQSYD